MSEPAPPDRPPSMQPPRQRSYGTVTSRCPAMWAVFDLLEQAAVTDVNLLVQGEAGSGKLLLATALHDRTHPDEPFVFCRCDTLGPDQVELSLFGASPAAGSPSPLRQGSLEAAGRGTLFLHRVEDLPIRTQHNLAAVLAAREYFRPGDPEPRPLLARVVAACDRPIDQEVQRGKFDENLLRHLVGLRIAVPPLCDRREDLSDLARQLLATAPALDLLPWPGNLPELAVFLEQANRAESAGADIERAFDPSLSFRDTRAKVQAEFERRYISWLLRRHDGNLSAAAREAAMDRKHLYDLALRHGLRRVRRHRSGR